jgi:hypothetical protein
MRTVAVSMLVAASLAAQTQGPDLQIEANGGRAIELPRGWPLLVLGILRTPPDAKTPLRLAPAAMAWFDAIGFQVTTAAGEQTGWELKLSRVPEGNELTLEPDSYTVLEWLMSAERTVQLREGTYQLTAALEVKEGGGWTGSVRSLPVEIRVISEPSPLTPELELTRARLRAQAAALEGRFEEAEAIIDNLLKTQPHSVYALQTMARLLERQGHTRVALAFAQLSLAEFRKQNPDAPEPPVGLHALIVRLRAAEGASPAPTPSLFPPNNNGARR